MLITDRQIPLLGVAMLLGAYSLQWFRQLPASILLLPCFVLAIVLLAHRRSRFSGAAILGFAIMWFAAADTIGDRLNPSLAGQGISVLGTVAEFPKQTEDSTRFEFEPHNRPDLPRRIRLGWYAADLAPKPGEKWHFEVRLQRPRGLVNPDGFDFSGWLFRQRIGATGYVVDPGDNRRLLAHEPDAVSRIRQRFVDRVARLLPADGAAAVLMAIGVGARHRISRADWDAYAATGTTHLMAISGLHIGLAAGSFFLLAWLLLAPFCRRLNARDIAFALAIMAAGAYAEISGFAIPARRAFLMVLFAACMSALRRRLSKIDILLVAALLVFLSDPVAILTPGFMLSFMAVAVLQISASQFRRQDEVAGSLVLGHAISSVCGLSRLQWALLCGLFPLSLLLFGRFSVAAPLVNLVVLPVFNFITVPFCLFGMLFDGPLREVGDALLRCSYQSIKLVLALVRLVAAQPGMHFETSALAPTLLGVACIPVLAVALPVGWPGRRIAILAIIFTVSHKLPVPAKGCLEYAVLDVGQGLSAVLRTAGHTLVFDTGPAFRGGNDVAQLAVLPFLQSRGISRINKIVVSHADLDHSGGLRSLLAGVGADEILVGEDLPVPSLQTTPCVAGSEWVWDGVYFEILHPRNHAAWEGNNLSCVLRVSAGNHRLLLTGDIETPVELLLAYRSVVAPVSVVVVPHHGSGTSSSDSLVNALRPALAIVSAGYSNRWGMPKGEVVGRWRASGATVVNTAYTGAVAQRLCAGQVPGRVRLARLDDQRYWHDQPANTY